MPYTCRKDIHAHVEMYFFFILVRLSWPLRISISPSLPTVPLPGSESFVRATVCIQKQCAPSIHPSTDSTHLSRLADTRWERS